MPRRYPAKFRRKVPGLVTVGRPVAADLNIGAQVIYTWRLAEHVQAVHEMSCGIYGARRVNDELHREMTGTGNSWPAGKQDLR